MRILLLCFFLVAVPLQAKMIDAFEAYNMPITDFVDWYSKALDVNVVVDSGVEGAVSFSAPRLDAANFDIFVDTVLESNGFKMEKQSGFYRLSLLTVADTPKEDSKKVLIVPPVTKFYDLNYVETTKVMELIRSVLDAFTENTGERKTAYSVLELPNANSIIVTGSPSQVVQIDNLIGRIDVRTKQILIDAIVMDTRVGDSTDIGVNLDVLLESAGFRLISNPLRSVGEGGILPGGSIIYDKGDVNALVNALTTNSDTKLLSKPYLLVMDREEGYINVGQEVPFLVSSETADNGAVIQKIERKNVGINLSVRPHIVNGSVILKINQSSSSVSDSDIATDIITNNRVINTVVQVVDGQSIMLGGLVSDEIRESESGVPVLKDLPLLGGLFRSTSSNTVKNQMSVLIKVTVI